MLRLSTAFNVLMNFGVAITYPTFISLGVVLSVPVNASKPLSPCGPNFLIAGRVQYLMAFKSHQMWPFIFDEEDNLNSELASSALCSDICILKQ